MVIEIVDSFDEPSEGNPTTDYSEIPLNDLFLLFEDGDDKAAAEIFRRNPDWFPDLEPLEEE